MLCMMGAALADPTPVDPGSFSTNAKFSVDKSAMTLSSAVAMIEPRLGAPGYSWLRISFYSFPLTPDDVAGVTSGNIESMERKWSGKANNPKDYNSSHAVIQLSVDAKYKVWQVDMSVPGHACTIAPFEQDVKGFLQTYQFDGKNLKLKSKGSYVCDMKFMGIPNQNFGWDIDVNLPVFEKAKPKK
ncbi:MAG: hypothetical protein LAN36_12080 [Acidobacteriia bacterium]|nr:hypothetical protein [Terriglobia bacterium]